MKRLNKHIRSADPATNHPEAYTAPAQPAAEDEVADFLWALTRLLKPDVVLETGTAFGHTAARICDALEQNGVGHLNTCEINPKRIPQAQERLAGRPATLWEMPYDRLAFKGEVIGLAFFDATRHNRDAEFHHFREWMRPDCVIVFHDTGPQHPGAKGVQNLVNAGLINAQYFACPRGIHVATLRHD